MMLPYTLGVYEDFEYPRLLIDISSVKSLKTYSYDQNLVLGANISLEDCISIFKDASATKNEFAYLAGLAKHLDLVAHIPVRKVRFFFSKNLEFYTGPCNKFVVVRFSKAASYTLFLIVYRLVL